MIDGAQDLLTSNLYHLNQKRQVWQAFNCKVYVLLRYATKDLASLPK